MIRKFDFLVIGSGVAGMSYALQVAASGKGKVALVCKTTLEEANTAKAQGGIAAVTDLDVDNFDKHIKDTLVAGDYISDPQAVRQVVKNAPDGIRRLVEWGVNFDKKADGNYDLHREGGHSEFRILHHADDTGFEIQRGLMEAVKNHPNITVLENHFAVEIITQHHLGVEVTRRTRDIECFGAYILDPDTQKIDTFLSKVTVLCTGGCGAVYASTTNPNIATGDGIAMAYRAKATVKDMEFIQFHPTALFHPGETHPAYLITEAMREALPLLGRKLRGFDLPDAVLTGPETRSSSPVRIPRGETLESVDAAGLYPCGEGAGYAGGITSAAVDGVRCAEAVLSSL